MKISLESETHWACAKYCTLQNDLLTWDSERQTVGGSVHTIRSRAILMGLAPPSKGHHGTTQDISGYGMPREQQASKRRLDSWKEIAAFFGRDERTVKRWEKERALPVHRVPGGVTRWCVRISAELSQWLRDPGAAVTESSEQASAPKRMFLSGDAIREAEPVISKQVFAPAIPARSSRFQVARILGLLLAILLGFLILKHQIPRQPTSASAINIPPAAHRPNRRPKISI